jgi:hypothetical protein
MVAFRQTLEGCARRIDLDKIRPNHCQWIARSRRGLKGSRLNSVFSAVRNYTKVGFWKQRTTAFVF